MAFVRGRRTPFASIANRTVDGMSASSNRLRDSPMDFSYDSPSRQRSGLSRMWLDTAGESSHQPMEVDENAKGNLNDRPEMQDQPLSPTVAGPDVDMMGMDVSPISERRQSSSQPLQKTRASDTIARTAQTALTRLPRQQKGTSKVSSYATPRRRTRAAQRADVSLDEEDDDVTVDDADESVEWQDEKEEEQELEHALGARGKSRSRRRSLRKRVGDTLNIQYFFNDSASRAGGPHMYKEQRLSATGSTAHSRWTDPEWCLGMAQFGFNAALLIGIAYVLFNVILTLQRDVSSKVREYELEYLAEIEACSQNFHLNRCGTSGAVPALASACASWQRCSARNPANVGRARVAAETVAEIVNGFVDVVSWKSMLFTLLTLIIVVGATNSFLSFFRIRSRQAHFQNESQSVRQVRQQAEEPIQHERNRLYTTQRAQQKQMAR